MKRINKAGYNEGEKILCHGRMGRRIIKAGDAAIE